MVKFELVVKSIKDLEDIYNAASKQRFNIDAGHGTHQVDAKSLMGLMSLSLPNVIEVECRSDKEGVKEFEQMIEHLKAR